MAASVALASESCRAAPHPDTMIYIYICSGCNWTSKRGFKLSVANIAILACRVSARAASSSCFAAT